MSARAFSLMFVSPVLFVLALLLLLPSACAGPHLHHERYHQMRFCDMHDGDAAVRLPDGMRPTVCSGSEDWDQV